MTDKTPTSTGSKKPYDGIGKLVNPGKTNVAPAPKPKAEKPKVDPKTAAARKKIVDLDKNVEKQQPLPFTPDPPKAEPTKKERKPRVAKAKAEPSAAITRQLEALAASNAKRFDKIEALNKKIDELKQDLQLARKESFEKGEAKGYKRGIADAAKTIREFKKR